MSNSFSINGLEQLTSKIQRIVQQQASQYERAAKDTAIYAKSQIPPYPVKSWKGGYKRTGRLGRSFATEVRIMGTTYVGILSNPVEYAPDVISAVPFGSHGPQKMVFARIGWYKLQDVVQKAWPRCVEIYHEAIRRAWEM